MKNNVEPGKLTLVYQSPEWPEKTAEQYASERENSEIGSSLLKEALFTARVQMNSHRTGMQISGVMGYMVELQVPGTDDYALFLVHVRAAEEEISVLGGFFRGKYYSSAQKLEEAINSAIKGRVAELCEAIQNLSSERRP